MRILLVLILPFLLQAVDIKGFAKSIPQYMEDWQQWDNSLRVRVLYEGSENFSTEAAYGVNFQYKKGINTLIQLQLNQARYRIWDLNKYISRSDSFDIQQNLDRLNVNVSGDRVDISIGRQAISFGSSKLVNPIDFLVPYSFNSLDVENRYGVDALRVRYSLGDMGELDFGVVSGEKLAFEESALFASIRYPMPEGFDALLIYSYFKENHLFGGDFQTEIGGAGVSLEFSYRKMRDDEESIYLTSGLEYRFNDEFLLFGEYHFNGSGTTDENAYLGQLAKASYQDGGIYNLSKNYIGIGANYLPFPLLDISLSVLANVDDKSVVNRLIGNYSVADDALIEIGLLLGVGSRGTEYSLQKSMIYSAFKWYF